MKNIENSSIVVQLDEVDDSLLTFYTIAWTSERDIEGDIGRGGVILIEHSSYTITGLTLDTVYTITVTAANECGTAPEYSTSVLLSADMASPSPTPISTFLLNPTSTIADSTNTVTIVSTTTADTTSSIVAPTPTVNLSEPTNVTSKYQDLQIHTLKKD